VRVPLALPLPAGGHYAASQPWFTSREPLTFEGWIYVQNGPPRALHAGEVTRIASMGRVGVYAELGTEAKPEVVYVPVDERGEFLPYASVTREELPCP
jgi:hypothetical protein